jgi:hypothetical protein
MTFGIYQFARVRVMSIAMEPGIRKDIQRRPQALDWLGLACMVGLRGPRSRREPLDPCRVAWDSLEVRLLA